jgi:glycosyltransferase involved in cell wall biosynthesis
VRLLVAIPVFNERRHVERVLAEIAAQVQPVGADILCVDDGSTDGTADLLASRTDIQLIRHPVNRGYGQSIIDAFNFADAHGYDWIITIDCDEQHEPQRIPEFIREIQSDQWDIISGSRYMQSQADNDLPPGDRRLINATITSLVNALFGWKLTDSFCGYKAHRVSAMKQLQLDEPGYAFPLQLWPRAARCKLRIKEIPVRLIYNDPNRHFGGLLDDAQNRLRHYLNILNNELQGWSSGAFDGAPDSICDCCGAK